MSWWSWTVFSIGSLFTGIGGIDLGFQCAGFDIRWQVEIEPFCQQVLAKHWPGVERHSDIYECHNLPYVDVITAGFPCQPFSVAGKQAGRDDERFLVPEMMRVINECQPKMVFLENVPGFASLNDGAEFKSLLRAFAKMGFDAQWGHSRASDAGAPHQRERWFCILGNCNNIRQKRNRANRQQELQTRHRQEASTGAGGQLGRARATTTQPGLVRVANGLPYRVDGHRFPNYRGLEPFEFEPPKVTERKHLRRDRIKALGNAVVPQCIEPIAIEMITELREGIFCDA
jgi:DNA (cytosine-5)-methyltransferase 1